MGLCGSKPAKAQHLQEASLREDEQGRQADTGSAGEQTPELPKPKPSPTSPVPLDSIRARMYAEANSPRTRISQEDAGSPGPRAFISPWNLAEAPPALHLQGEARLPYPVPFIPQPSLRGRASLPGSATSDRSLASEQEWLPGARRALLIGCNYSDDLSAQIRGSVLDVHCLARLLLIRCGFQASNTVVLHDDQPHANYLPTRDNILAAVQWLMTGCQPQDSLVFAFCGLCVTNSDASELDGDFREGEEEGLLPCDFEREGVVASAQLTAALSGALVEGARLHCFIDTGSSIAFTLPCTTSMRKDSWLDWEEDAIADVLAEDADIMHQRFLRPRGHAWPSPRGGEIVLICSAPEDDDDIDDASIAQYPSKGAIIFSLVQAIDQGHGDTYHKLMRAMRYALKNGAQHFEASPELSSSRLFDLNRPFLL